jgi:GH25 family lysozyme M1 (1,4-beta-N-acetylmuramidase)
VTVLYVDLSHHDVSRRGGLPDWAAIRQATSPVMCARASYGDPQGFNPPSRYFREFVSGARAAGFTLLGGYHNLVRGDQASINRQVDLLRREMDAAGANWAMLDVERYGELLTRNLHPRFADAVAFCQRWRAVDKRAITVYLPRWIWEGHMDRPDLRLLGAPLVASNYGSNPDGNPTAVYRARGGDAGVGWEPYGNVTPTVWQFGSNVDCPGASGATDVNAFRGSLADLTRILNPAAAAATPQQEDDMTPQQFLAILDDPKVATKMRALGWQYTGGGIPAGMSTLNVLNELVTTTRVVAGKVAGDLVDEAAIADAVLARLGSRSAADVLKALTAAGVDVSALRAEMDRTSA